MKQTYRIRSGAFQDADGTTKGAGETIELDSDVAQAHAHRLEPVSAVLKPTKAVPMPDGPAAQVDRFR